MTDHPKISMKDNGPLIVANPPNLNTDVGADIETGGMAALCRCGQSSKKPFCDGSHHPEFQSAPDHTRLRNAAIDYTGTVDGTEVTISYTPVLCTHAAECQARAAAVFDPKRKPWIKPEEGSISDILDVMAACPSGALRVTTSSAPPQHLTTGEVSIRVQKDGPYHVTNIELDAEFNGVGSSKAKYSLCRCGLSRNKPFCDGSHHGKWTDDA